jgi:DNA-binding GntR family transcriptional regulator
MFRDVISHHGGPPVYQQIAATLRGEIAQGILPAGENLPSEKDIADRFDVGRDSVRDALALLKAEGLIEKRRGFRSRVRQPLVRTRVEIPAGATVSARMPTPEERAVHDVPDGVPMLLIGSDSYPANLYEAYTP